MRSILLLMLLASCAAAPTHPTHYTANYAATPSELMSIAIDTTRAQHYDVIAVDADRGMFLALPSEPATSHVHEALGVRIAETGPACALRTCSGLTRATIAVTPFAFEGGHELALERVPATAHTRAEQLLLSIRKGVSREKLYNW